MTRIRNIICAALLAAIVLSCEQPFKVGLGPKEDITPPQFDVNSITPKSGAYLGKEVTIEGVASDDLGVQKVEVSFDGQSWSPVTSFDKTTGEWSYEFDSEEYPDGNLSLSKITRRLLKYKFPVQRHRPAQREVYLYWTIIPQEAPRR